MCRPGPAGIIALAAALALPAPAAQAPESSVTVVSPAVAITWIGQPGADGQVLDLLVLWRGAPGWFTAQPQTSVSGVTGRNVFTRTDAFGSIELALAFNTRTRTATLAGVELPLDADNVVFVDTVDTTPRVQRTLRIDPTLPDSGNLLSILRRSDAIIGYLRCGVSVGDKDRDAMLARLCAVITGGGQM